MARCRVFGRSTSSVDNRGLCSVDRLFNLHTPSVHTHHTAVAHMQLTVDLGERAVDRRGVIPFGQTHFIGLDLLSLRFKSSDLPPEQSGVGVALAQLGAHTG